MPLSQLTVIDLATLAAAPQIAAFFGDFGARVVKVEHPRGDSLRKLVDPRGVPLTWKIVNRSKQHVTLDVTKPDGRALHDEMLARARVNRGGRPKSAAPKVLLSVRYSPEVVEYFRSTGEGWQARMDAVLKEHVLLHRNRRAAS